MQEHISYFHGWTDRDFAIWLASFIDGEGCIYIPKTPGVDLSIGNTNRDIVYSIQDRLGCGYVHVTQQTRAGWKTKYSWRVRDATNVRRILVMVLPYLTFKQSQAVAALGKIAHLCTKADKRRAFVERILYLQSQKLSHEAIGLEMGCSRSNISLLLKQVQ